MWSIWFFFFFFTIRPSVECEWGNENPRLTISSSMKTTGVFHLFRLEIVFYGILPNLNTSRLLSKCDLFLLEYSWFLMISDVLLVSGTQQSESFIYIYTYIHSFLGSSMKVEFPVLYSRFLLVTYFIYSSVYTLIPTPNLSSTSFPLW